MKINAKTAAMFAAGVVATNVVLEVLAIRGIWDYRTLSDMFAPEAKPTTGDA